MKMIHWYLPIFFLCIGQTGSTQTILPSSPNMQMAYAKGTRDRSGAPSISYWQNRADYALKVSYDPGSRALKGWVDIDYINNSPDTLDRLVFKLYPNLYKGDAMRNTVVSPADLGEGMRIDTIRIDGDPIDAGRRKVRGTNMFLKIKPLLPRQHRHITIGYSYTLNQGSFIRTGLIDSGAAVIAYFFPRVAVYDDIDGWNEYPYMGKEEFYHDYGNFDVDIEVPGNYQVWATGSLTNTDAVYSAKYVQRIRTAETQDTVTDVIGPKDLEAGGITVNQAMNHWKFSAREVTDFAFAISNHYIWKASSLVVDSLTKRRTRVDAVFNPLHTSFLPVAGYARQTVDLISRYLPGIPFPYPHQTIFEGLDAMEYPMMVNELPFADKKEMIQFTAHEVFHAIFPFYVGTNETKFSFMDEGWATLSEFLLYPMIEPGSAADYDCSSVNLSAGSDEDVPIMTPTPQLYGKARFADKDLKPALGFFYIREMLGDSLFLKGLQAYIHQWQGRHPSPYDLFYSMNTATGINLDWFWMNWFFEKNVPDLAIGRVSRKQKDYSVVISNPGTAAVPVHLTIVYQDGSTQVIHKSIGAWSDRRKEVILSFRARSAVKELVLGDGLTVDVNLANNHWRSTPVAPASSK